MELPRGKKGPKLPRKAVGGGAAGRQRQAELERGLGAEGCGANQSVDETAASTPDDDSFTNEDKIKKK